MSERRLPAKLRKRVASASRDVRLHAVPALEQIATGADTGLAEIARAALRDLLTDDSRAVVEAAEAALGRTTLGLTPDHLDFGDVVPGTPRLTASVAVTGARADTISTSGAALRATLDGDRVLVSWLPSAGSFAGTVTVGSPAGTASLAVTAQGGTFGESPSRPPERRLLAPLVAAAAVVVLLILAGVWALSGRHDDVLTGMPLPGPSTPPPSVEPLLASSDTPSVVTAVRVGAEPEGVAVSPDGRTIYVANQSSRVLSIIDADSRSVTPLTLRNTAHFVAVSRDGRKVYVSMYEKNLTGSGVAVVDAATRKVTKYLNTGVQPFDLAVAPDGRLWVPIHGGRSVEIYAAADERPAGTVLMPKNPHSVAFSADGQRAFTPDHESNSMSVIDMRTDRRVATMRVSRAPHSVAVTPDGRKVIVAAYEANAVDIIDTVTLRRAGPFPVGVKPQSVAVSADGAHAYAVNEGDGTISVLRVRDGRVTATVRVGRSPRTVAVTPDGRFAYVTNGDDNTLSVLSVTG